MTKARVAGVVLLVVAALLAPAGPADATAASVFDGDPATTERLTVSDPVRLAVELSGLRFDAAGAAHVVLSRDDVFADSLAGAPLSADGPLLLTGPQALTDASHTELRRALREGGRVYLLGGENAISTGIEEQLRGEGYEVVRLAGRSRVETAVAVAQEVRRLNPSVEQAVLARAYGTDNNPTAAWADSVTGGAWATAAGVPVFITPTDSLHPAVQAALGSPRRTVLLGGEAALRRDVASSVPNPVRVAGPTRTATAAAISRELWGNVGGPFLVVPGFRVDGWAYGLTSAGLAADVGVPLLLADTGVASQSTLDVARSCGTPSVETALIGDKSVLTAVVAAEFDAVDGSYCPPPVGRGSFGAGQQRVGRDIQAGTYRSAPTDYCYWERLRGFSGELDDIIANQLADHRLIVTIEASDAGFDSVARCRSWSADLSPLTQSPLQPIADDGVFVIGSEVAPGTWRTMDAEEGCYWERLSGFSGELHDIVANDIVDQGGPTQVQINPTDVGFSSRGCGQWTWVGP